MAKQHKVVSRICPILLCGMITGLASQVHADDNQALHYDEPKAIADDASPFSLKLEYGQTSAGGKSEYLSRNGKISTAYNDGIDEIRLDADHNYLKSGSKLASDRRHAYVGYDRYLGWRWWLFVLSDYEKNEAIGLNYTQLSGGGFKFDLLRNKTWKSNIGLAYLKRAKQTKIVDEETKLSTLKTQDDKVLSARFRIGVRVDKFKLGTTVFYQPVVDPDDTKEANGTDQEYNWSNESDVSYYFSENLFAKMSYFYRYESLQIKPGQSRKEERNVLSIGYEL